MKKILFAVLTVVMIGACNSPQKMSGTGSDSTGNGTNSNGMMQGDTTARRDSL